MLEKTYSRDSVTVTFEALDAGEDAAALAKALGLPHIEGVFDCLVVSFPTKLELCPVCGGHGTHVHPDIDRHGLTPSELASWDEEERRSYYSGAYDVPCRACQGNKTLQVVDHDACVSKQHEEEAMREGWSPFLFLLQKYYTDGEADASYDAEAAAERAMGA